MVRMYTSTHLFKEKERERETETENTNRNRTISIHEQAHSVVGSCSGICFFAITIMKETLCFMQSTPSRSAKQPPLKAKRQESFGKDPGSKVGLG